MASKFKSRRVASIRTFPEAFFNLIPKANQDDIQDCINHSSGDNSAEPFTTNLDNSEILGQVSKLLNDVAAVKVEENPIVNVYGFSVDRMEVDPNSELENVMPIASTKTRTVSAVRNFPRFCGKVIEGDCLINEGSGSGSNKSQFSGVLMDHGEPQESAGFYIQDSVCSNAKEKVQQLAVEKLALNSQSGIPGFNHTKANLSEKIDNLHDGADHLQATVSSKKISCPKRKQSDRRKTSKKKHLDSPEFKDRVIVHALVAAPGCPWNERKT